MSNLLENEFQLDPDIQEKLDVLLQLISENEVIQEFQRLEEKINQNESIQQLTEEIKQAQQDAVQFGHYDKPNAEQEAIRRADELTKQLDEHPLVVRYREVLFEANDLLHSITTTIEQAVNEQADEKNEE